MKTTIAVICTLALTLPGFAADDKAQKKITKLGIDLEAIFKKIDGNNDGKLSKDEFGKFEGAIRDKGDKAVKIADRLKSASNELFAKLDENKDSSLSLEEVKKFDIAAIAGGGAKAAVKDLDATFKKLDGNSDGKLSKDEFTKVADQLAANKPDKVAKVAEKLKGLVDGVFTKLDENKDGNLNADEFKKFTGLKDKQK